LASKKLVVIGGVAGGATAAARARRLSEDAEIVLIERGPHVSFANCGLPYFLGGEIADEQDLLLQTPASLRARYNLDLRTLCEATRIDRTAQEVELRDMRTGAATRESYDALILATGARPLKPPIPGIERDGHFTLRSIEDMEAIDRWIVDRKARTAVVVGGGYIGLEMAEQLTRRGLTVALAEALPQVMAALDPEMAAHLHAELRANGVALHLSDGVASFEEPAASDEAAASVVVLKSGARLPADVVILGLGVRPEADLAREAGLEMGALGGIRVSETLQTSDPRIWAIGDVIEVRHGVTGEWSLIPLAGPANRHGRIAADNVFGRTSACVGTWGTGILRLFSLTAAGTGANEGRLRKAGIPHAAVHLHPGSHAGYFPGAQPIALKVLFDPDTGKLLGAQAVGRDGVDKRIDVFATALRAGLTVHDLVSIEFAYAPPYGSAKDPVNLAGMVAQNVVEGASSVAQWWEIPCVDLESTIILDVRTPGEVASGMVPGAVHIPLHELRARAAELPKGKDVIVYCRSGQRSYVAERILRQRGFAVRNLSGAWLTWTAAAGAERR
jgi:NADPH-dependent 2,4-dienoyl-CoA reductase/sulfur reductase-like enzyme/rhodanese-related sulfurtransferase